MRATTTRIFVSTVLACSVFCGFAEEAQPAELEKTESDGFSVEVSLDVLSDYVWRGTICNGNPVWQPSVTFGYDFGEFGNVGLNLWQSYDLTHKRGTATNSRRACGHQETDYTLTYGKSFGDVDVELGHIFYTFPNNNGTCDQDVYASVAYNNDYVTPSAAVYWNYGDGHDSDPSGVYFSFGLSHEFAFGEKFTLTPSASLGFGDHVAAGDTSGGAELTDQTIGLAAGYAITENVSVGAQINYTWTPSHTLRHNDYMGCNKDQLVWGGVNVTLSF